MQISLRVINNRFAFAKEISTWHRRAVRAWLTQLLSRQRRVVLLNRDIGARLSFGYFVVITRLYRQRSYRVVLEIATTLTYLPTLRRNQLRRVPSVFPSTTG